MAVSKDAEGTFFEDFNFDDKLFGGWVRERVRALDDTSSGVGPNRRLAS